MKKKKQKSSKDRNWLAVHAKGLTGRRGSGSHGDKRKERQRRACRGKVRN